MIVATAASALEATRLYKTRDEFFHSLLSNVPEIRHMENALKVIDARLKD